MNKLEAARLLLDFHFAPPAPAKDAIWEDISPKPRPYCDEDMTLLIDQVLDGRILTDTELKLIRIVAEPSPPPTDATWAAQIAAANSSDTEAAHADADRLLVNLVHSLGYVKSAAAYQAVEKWYA